MDAKRRLWLIDGGYLFSTQTAVERGYQFDYKKLRSVIERDGPLWRAYYLNAIPSPPTDAQNSFHTFLQSAPPFGPKIITKLYSLKRLNIDRAYCEDCQRLANVECSECGSGLLHREQQKGIDVGIATLALTLMDEYDTLVLSSGDGDLLDAVDYVTHGGRELELVVFKAGVSTDLQARADRILWIDDFREDVRRTRDEPQAAFVPH